MKNLGKSENTIRNLGRHTRKSYKTPTQENLLAATFIFTPIFEVTG